MLDHEHIPLLDHGYVRVVDTWGTDERVVEAARMSTAKGFQGWGGAPCPDCKLAGRLDPHDSLFLNTECYQQAKSCVCKGSGVTSGDEKLLAYLWKHKHATPFEMLGATFEIKAPIFVMREWMRHRSASYNELSARYTAIPDEHYVPSVERLLHNANGTNKQANRADGALPLTVDDAVKFQASMIALNMHAQSVYAAALSSGVPKELARCVIPVGRYSVMRASANLRNWLGFISLRSDSSAQWEIQQYSNTVRDCLIQAFPRVMDVVAAA